MNAKEKKAGIEGKNGKKKEKKGGNRKWEIKKRKKRKTWDGEKEGRRREIPEREEEM